MGPDGHPRAGELDEAALGDAPPRSYNIGGLVRRLGLASEADAEG